MGSVRKIASVLAGLWLVGMLALGIGGSWLTNNSEEVAEGALGIAGIDVEEMRAHEQRERSVRAAKREARVYKDAGWGDRAVPQQDSVSDWGQ